jgi:hypothetical protein
LLDPRAQICKAAGSLGNAARYLAFPITHLWAGHDCASISLNIGKQAVQQDCVGPVYVCI